MGREMTLIEGLMKTLGRQARKPRGWLGNVLFGYLATSGHRPLTNWAMGFLDVQPADRVLTFQHGAVHEHTYLPVVLRSHTTP